MQTEEFITITHDSILNLLRERYGYDETGHSDARRGRLRWPFPGTTELWIPLPDGEEDYLLARALNLSPAGVGILCDEELQVGAEISIAIHQPEATFFGKATVRHCSNTGDSFHCGLEFVY